MSWKSNDNFINVTGIYTINVETAPTRKNP